MTTCTQCHTPFPSALDEYGPRDAPLCSACFLTAPSDPFQTENALLQDARKEQSDLQDDIAAQLRFINDLVEGYEMGEMDITKTQFNQRVQEEHEELWWIQLKLYECEERIRGLQQEIETRKQLDRARLDAWKASAHA